VSTRTTATAVGPADSINIRPGVSILSVLRHLNYKPWFAMAEFVDNSLQSYLTHAEALRRLEGESYRLRVVIEPDVADRGRLTIRDNAAGIYEGEYPRAFRPAEVPPDRTGLAEFGMGMKSAACWFSRCWTVRTTALGEPVERTVSFDIDRIVRDSLEELHVETRPAEPDAHYTEIILSALHKPLQTRTITKVREHLASIYRVFLDQGALELVFDRETLSYAQPAILIAPYFKDPSGDSVRWYKQIDLDFGLGLRAHGFAALRDPGNVSKAGFALFRRNRLIEGSADESYRPEYIFGKSNSYRHQRLFGELQLEGFEVSHTKDGFRWDEHEEIVLDLLKAALDAEPLPLLAQAEGHRSRLRTEDVRSGAEIATERTAETIEREAPHIIEHQLGEETQADVPPVALPAATSASHRVIEVDVDHSRWRIELELTTDASVSDWVTFYDKPASATDPGSEGVRELGIRVALVHPFMERFAGPDPGDIEPLLRVAVAIVLAEITAREGGVRYAGEIRRRINELLRDALSKP
jgi:Histidine kinase-, DNA gyrase B-, and HSP90-like ATPase